MTVKERILERFRAESAAYGDCADEARARHGECETETRFRWISNAFSRAIYIVTEEFAKEGEDGKDS